jgi:nitroimidazol reductase NimA-like FMN-containing flavoprotein (pyridoxamine 5'-phosphate oxidase superfamily)
MLEEMKALAKQKDMCVLATVSGGNPHCSLMAYATDDDCREIYMVTQKGTKKYQNLIENPSVSLLIDTREEQAVSRPLQAKALTIAGLFQKIDDQGKKSLARARLLERHPHLAGFIDQTDTELLCIKATSFLLLNGLKEAHFETV